MSLVGFGSTWCSANSVDRLRPAISRRSATVLQDEFDIEIDHPHEGDRVVVSVSGEIDAATAPDLLGVVLVVAGWHSVGHVVVDLTDVSFIDSHGISALVRCRHHLDDAHLRLSVEMGDVALNVLTMTGVLEFLSGARMATSM